MAFEGDRGARWDCVDIVEIRPDSAPHLGALTPSSSRRCSLGGGTLLCESRRTPRCITLRVFAAKEVYRTGRRWNQFSRGIANHEE